VRRGRSLDLGWNGKAKGATVVEVKFTLVLEGCWDDLTHEMVDSLYEAGCDDGTVAYRGGRVVIVFDREAETAEAAVLSAIADVRKAGFHVARIAEVDSVEEAAMAERLAMPREFIEQLIRGKQGPGSFPPAVFDGPNWSWREVAGWLVEAGLAEPSVAETARVLAAVDAALAYRAARRDSPTLLDAVEAAVR
jgi:hypothetical protein